MLKRKRDIHKRQLCDDGLPLISVEAKLIAEVERTRERHEAACEDLRRWRLSHDVTETPAPTRSVYEDRGPYVFTLRR